MDSPNQFGYITYIVENEYFEEIKMSENDFYEYFEVVAVVTRKDIEKKYGTKVVIVDEV